MDAVFHGWRYAKAATEMAAQAEMSVKYAGNILLCRLPKMCLGRFLQRPKIQQHHNTQHGSSSINRSILEYLPPHDYQFLKLGARRGRRKKGGIFCLLRTGAYLNMMMPPMKVAQRAAPHEVAKERRWASLAAVRAPVPEGEPRMASGTKRTPAAKKHTAARNRVAHPIASTPVAAVGRGGRRRGRIWERVVGELRSRGD